ncbi:hypothetical protein [Spirosoma pollinicola]|uniref:Transposase n=1 Tax=Spirosoma pollinicola TaxID=2057025 RepID=A0A2K8Z464_9BACT|nr:hypothetical protein [Spirosoma pollinicola]AUD04655.1 hypothetical protein CWM47_24075 [Spirosoma pollinicola]
MLTKKSREAIIRSIKEEKKNTGKTNVQIALEYGISVRTLYEYLKCDTNVLEVPEKEQLKIRVKQLEVHVEQLEARIKLLQAFKEDIYLCINMINRSIQHHEKLKEHLR